MEGKHNYVHVKLRKEGKTVGRRLGFNTARQPGDTVSQGELFLKVEESR